VITRPRQSGITLVVSLIMLVVLTLLVVSAIRFGNINLKISGNAQAEAEAAAAVQVAVEKMMGEVVGAVKVDLVPAQPAMQVSTGASTYSVNVQKPVCTLSKSIRNTELSNSKPADLPCFGNNDQQDQVDANGKVIQAPTTCKSQQWEIKAALTDSPSGAQISMLQGVALRVPSEVQCP
jgi:Tfp pilus assembly protein PilX